MILDVKKEKEKLGIESSPSLLTFSFSVSFLFQVATF